MKMQQDKKLKSLHILKRILFVFAFLNFINFSFAENENSKLANKKTALRCLETASNYIFEKKNSYNKVEREIGDSAQILVSRENCEILKPMYVSTPEEE